jgi:hypothetical protein
MSRGAYKIISWGLAFALMLFSSPYFSRSQAGGKGHLVGYVFHKDGSTPVQGVVVVAKNVTTGTVFQSAKTDSLGVFKFEGLDAGIYALGVTSVQGNYNSQDLVGIKADETAKISIALNPFDRESIEAAQAVAKEEKERGESRVGKVVAYSPGAKEAVVSIERGLIQSGDRIRVRGSVTDFSQDVTVLKVRGARATRALSGDQALLPVARTCAAGDDVYVVCKRGVPPLFLAPLGLAAIVAGSISLVTIVEEESVTPTKPPGKIKG